MAKKDGSTLDMVAWILVIVGALNWGLVGALNLDLVQLILGSVPVAVKAVYVLVGLSALYMIYMKMQK